MAGLSRGEKLSYGLGDFACNLSWNFISGFLLFFLVNVALLPAATAGTLMLVAMILSAVFDPVAGVLVDRTHSRFGKARPFLLYGALPLGVASAFLFLSPFQDTTLKTIYAYVTLLLVQFFYSFINIPYGTLMPLMTRDPDEKMQLSSLRTIGSSVGTFLATGLTMPIVALFGADRRKGFACAGILFATLLTVLVWIVFRNCRERYQDHKAANPVKLRVQLHYMLMNGPWRVTFVFGLLMLMRLGALIASTTFFCIHVLHKPALISILLPLLSATSLCVAPFAPAYFRRTGLRNGILLLLGLSAAGMLLLPLVEGNLWAFLVVYTVVAALSVGPCTTSIYAMAANSVDYHQWAFGERNDGLVYSSISIATKIGIAIGSSGLAYVLAWTGFHADHPSAHSLMAIRHVYYGAPFAIMILQAICIAFYRLDRLHPQIVTDLAARSTAVQPAPVKA
jgi:glycoside/pentoside/hexuronide:cation symporter, GPH family